MEDPRDDSLTWILPLLCPEASAFHGRLELPHLRSGSQGCFDVLDPLLLQPRRESLLPPLMQAAIYPARPHSAPPSLDFQLPADFLMLLLLRCGGFSWAKTSVISGDSCDASFSSPSFETFRGLSVFLWTLWTSFFSLKATCSSPLGFPLYLGFLISLRTFPPQAQPLPRQHLERLCPEIRTDQQRQTLEARSRTS